RLRPRAARDRHRHDPLAPHQRAQGHQLTAAPHLHIPMNKISFIALLVVGIVLLVLGIIEADSISSSFSRLFTGEPTDKSIWLMLGGGLATIVGLGGVTRGSK